MKLTGIKKHPEKGMVIEVEGADLMDGTPIYDMKPYIPVSDCHPEASEGYTSQTKVHALQVEFPEELLSRYPEEKRKAVIGVLSQDPRPAYVQDPERLYGVSFAGFDVKFKVVGDLLTVEDVVPLG